MASISSTNSLGNTSLRGYGGMASGIDRDAIIEQMTLGTTTKITNQESAITKLEWKQEAYRSISDKILDLYDNYSSYTSPTSLKDPNTFAKSLISVIGKDTSTKFVSATGTSALVGNVSIQSVKQLATSSVYKSDARDTGKLTTELSDLDDPWYSSNLAGGQIRFVKENESDGSTLDMRIFTMPTTYKTNVGSDNEETVTINYYRQNGETEKEYGERLAREINTALSQSEYQFSKGKKADGSDDTVKMSECFEFAFQWDATSNTGKMQLTSKGSGLPAGYKIAANSSALKGLGYTGEGKGMISSLDELNGAITNNFSDSAITTTHAIDYLKNQKLTFNFDGSKKDIVLITEEEAKEFAGLTFDSIPESEKTAIRRKVELQKIEDIEKRLREENPDIAEDELNQKVIDELNALDQGELDKETLARYKMEKMASNLQERLNRAFGTDMVQASVADDGTLSFSTKESTSTVSVSSNDGAVIANLGITNGDSNKVNLSGKLDQANLGIDFKEVNKDGKGLVINGVTIGGIDENTTISSILSKINSNEQVGVKATYVDATGQFMLVSSETGEARNITLDSKLAQKLFGGTEAKGNGLVKGQDAIIEVSYGNGVNVEMKRSSNSFNLEGMDVTVSGVFGGEWSDGVEVDANAVAGENQRIVQDKNGKYLRQDWKADTSEAVSFSAKADVDKVTEKVKKFFEDFNAIASEINTQVTTRPDSSYGPLTDEQKDEMSETSIENWEKKAKSGLLFNDSTMRDLSMDVQSIYTKLMRQSGLSYEDLKELGITYSDNEKDGGTLVFDETAFRNAMESKPDKVSALFTGGNGMGDGLVKIVEDTFTPYATRFASRNGNSYGRLIEEAGSEKVPTSLMKNQIYNEIKSKQDLIEQLRAKLKTEQDRYISQFTTMETMINQMNSQASYLSQITG